MSHRLAHPRLNPLHSGSHTSERLYSKQPSRATNELDLFYHPLAVYAFHSRFETETEPRSTDKSQSPASHWRENSSVPVLDKIQPRRKIYGVGSSRSNFVLALDASSFQNEPVEVYKTLLVCSLLEESQKNNHTLFKPRIPFYFILSLSWLPVSNLA